MVPKAWCPFVVSLLLLAKAPAASDVVDVAASLIGRPYVWGGDGPSGFDCSGLTQYAYQRVGIDLPRRAINQADAGDAARRLRRGDLVFFSSDERRSKVTHVGIYEGGGVMIDASKRHGRVRRDDLSDPYWTATFMRARRVTDDIARGGDTGDAWPPASPSRRPDSRSDARREAVRTLGRLAEVLLQRR